MGLFFDWRVLIFTFRPFVPIECASLFSPSDAVHGKMKLVDWFSLSECRERTRVRRSLRESFFIPDHPRRRQSSFWHGRPPAEHSFEVRPQCCITTILLWLQMGLLISLCRRIATWLWNYFVALFPIEKPHKHQNIRLSVCVARCLAVCLCD